MKRTITSSVLRGRIKEEMLDKDMVKVKARVITLAIRRIR